MARIALSTTINAEADQIVKVIDSAAGLAGFWTEDIDYAGAGGVLKAGFAGNPAPFEFRVDEVSPQRVQWTNIGGFPPFFAGTGVTWALMPAPEGTGTVVLFTHDGWPDDDMPMPMIAYVWAQVLASLKAYIETGTGQPLYTRG